ncbi:MAG TPA: hypothetical protein GX708_16995 [Gallicola sp.]|nr:hypothetical protein [Gallicola sp.]
MAILEKWERETVIAWDDSTHSAILTTYKTSMIKKMDEYCIKHPKEYKMFNEIILDGEVVGKEYKFPKRLVTVRQPSTRTMTEEQKKASAERLKKARDKKK